MTTIQERIKLWFELTGNSYYNKEVTQLLADAQQAIDQLTKYLDDNSKLLLDHEKTIGSLAQQIEQIKLVAKQQAFVISAQAYDLLSYREKEAADLARMKLQHLGAQPDVRVQSLDNQGH